MSAHSDRLAAVRALLSGLGLQGVVVSDPDNRFYLSGFTANDHGPSQSAGGLLIDPSNALLLTGRNNMAWAAAESPSFEVVEAGRSWVATATKLIEELGWSRIGYEGASLSHAAYERLAPKGSKALYIDVSGNLDQLRWSKDAAEIGAIEDAIQLTDQAFESVWGSLSEGESEREIALRISRTLLDCGADGDAFPPIVASGPHAARPHHRPTDRPVMRGEPVIIDMGARLAGYNADLTRTVWLGTPEDQLTRCYRTVMAAHAAAIEAVRPGIACREVDSITRTTIEEAGLGDFVVHSVGHGLGVRVHDGPSVSIASDDVLREGQVVTIEPGVYIPDWGGVRMEDVVVVEARGARRLTGASKMLPLGAEKEVDSV